MTSGHNKLFMVIFFLGGGEVSSFFEKGLVKVQ